jgi:hypothetical protein
VTFKVLAGCAAAAICLAAAGGAAATINSPIPTNAYITYNGLDWAWGAPIADPTGLYLTYQGTQGWHVATAQELANAPNAANFMFAGANVPYNGTDPVSGAVFADTNANYATLHSAGACATPYFSSGYAHCDFDDGNGQSFTWAGTNGNQGNNDQLYVRASVSNGVPEPATWTTLIFGFGAVGAMLRRRKFSLA